MQLIPGCLALLVPPAFSLPPVRGGTSPMSRSNQHKTVLFSARMPLPSSQSVPMNMEEELDLPAGALILQIELGKSLTRLSRNLRETIPKENKRQMPLKAFQSSLSVLFKNRAGTRTRRSSQLAAAQHGSGWETWSRWCRSKVGR